MGHTYPYTLNGVDVATLTSSASTDNIHVVRANKSDVDQLRSFYDSLLPDALSSTHCVAFACGGIVFLNYIVSAFSRHCWGRPTVADFNQMKSCQARFHLLPSTTWQVSAGEVTRNCQSELENWLTAHDSASQVMLVDTSFSGGAINNLKNAITQIPTTRRIPHDILLCGVVDLERYGKERLPDDEAIVLRAGGRLRVRWLGVPNLVSEDVMALLGYNRCKMKAQLKPQWPESLLVIDVDDDNTIAFSTSTAAAVFSKLLVDWKQGVGKARPFPTAKFDPRSFVAEVKQIRAALWPKPDSVAS